MNAGSLEALWVTRPEAVGLERTKTNPPGDGRVLIFAADEVHVLLFAPASTLNTGNVRHGRPLDILERI